MPKTLTADEIAARKVAYAKATEFLDNYPYADLIEREQFRIAAQDIRKLCSTWHTRLESRQSAAKNNIKGVQHPWKPPKQRQDQIDQERHS